MTLHRTTFRNASAKPLMLRIEPWGEEHEIQREEAVDVAFYGPIGGLPEVVAEGQALTVFGWEGARHFVLKNNLCINQPSLQSIIGLFLSERSESGVLAQFDFERDVIEASQALFDSAPFWDETGGEVAASIITKLGPTIAEHHGVEAAAEFCRQVLNLRGVFPSEQSLHSNEFWEALRLGRPVLNRLLEGGATQASEPSIKRPDRSTH